jgi:hypothetical protein
MIKIQTSVDLNDQDKIDKYINTLVDAKKNASENGDEDKANQLWCDIQAFKISATFVSAIKNIKQSKYRNAWSELEQCEITCKSLCKNSNAGFFKKSGAQFIETYVEKWQSLYPYCMFLSPGMVVGYYTCSICNHKIRPRSRCPHIKGRIYNGELCTHQAHDIEIKEISIVTKPVQKFSVIHDDETLDFSLLDYLCLHIKSPFDEWETNWTTKTFPRHRFNAVNEDQKCPCQSGNIFRSCCFDNLEIDMPHVDFEFENGPNEQAEIERFPY